MLIENKIIFIGVPKCASYSFRASCLIHNLKTEYVNETVNNTMRLGMELQYHHHDTIEALEKKFGTKYPYIAIKRDPVKRFISGWGFFIQKVVELFPHKRDYFLSLDNDYVISFLKKNVTNCDLLLNKKTIEVVFDNFLIEHNVTMERDWEWRKASLKLNTMTSQFAYHKNRSFIKFFDITNMSELETYMSEMLNVDFKMVRENETRVVTALENNKQLTDFVYSYVEPNLTKKSLI
jgi:hypothetical protein